MTDFSGRTALVPGASCVGDVSGHTPLARLGEFEDVAAAVAFLAAHASASITGRTIVIDGGRLVRWR